MIINIIMGLTAAMALMAFAISLRRTVKVDESESVLLKTKEYSGYRWMNRFLKVYVVLIIGVVAFQIMASIKSGSLVFEKSILTFAVTPYIFYLGNYKNIMVTDKRIYLGMGANKATVISEITNLDSYRVKPNGWTTIYIKNKNNKIRKYKFKEQLSQTDRVAFEDTLTKMNIPQKAD